VNYQALIHFKNIKDIKLLKLPMCIGMDQNAQIFINNSELGGNNYFLTTNNDVAILLDENGKIVPLNILKKYGIKVLGIVANGKTGLLNKFLAMEKQLFSGVSDNAKDFLFYKGSSNYRYGLYGILLSLMITGPYLFSSNSQINVDQNLSHQVLQLKSNIQDNQIYGNFGRFNKNPDGVKFNLNLAGNKSGKVLPGSISFIASGLDNNGEVKLVINDKSVFSSKVEEQCFKSGCLKSVKLPTDILKLGSNKVEFQHDLKDSAYLVGKVKFTALKELDGALDNRVNLYLDEASGLFENRNLGIVNLIKARDLTAKIDGIGKDYFIPTELSDKLVSLQSRIIESIKQSVDDFWFTIDKKISLGQYDAALTDLNEMTVYFPDSSTNEGRKVIQNIKRINQILGR
jgi:hypothetical protein